MEKKKKQKPKRQRVSKAFVQKECGALGERLKKWSEGRIACEINDFAAMVQHALEDIESRLSRLESTGS